MNEVIDHSRNLRRVFLSENIKNSALQEKLFNLDEDFSFLDFYIACRIYSEYLFNSGRLRDYEEFCNNYNEFINSDVEMKILFSNAKWNWVFKKFSFFMKSRILSKVNKVNTERALQLLFFEDFNNVTDQEITKKEIKIGKGRCDLLVDLFGKKTAIELKNQAAKRKDVYQAFEYLVDDKVNGKADDAVLIAYSFDEDVIEIAEKLNVKLYSLSWEETEEYVDHLYLEKVSGDNEALEYILQDCNCFKLHQKDYNFREKVAEEVKSIIAHFENILSLHFSNTENSNERL